MFRDDRDALAARTEALEQQLRETREELSTTKEELREAKEPKKREPKPEKSPLKLPPATPAAIAFLLCGGLGVVAYLAMGNASPSEQSLHLTWKAHSKYTAGIVPPETPCQIDLDLYYQPKPKGKHPRNEVKLLNWKISCDGSLPLSGVPPGDVFATFEEEPQTDGTYRYKLSTGYNFSKTSRTFMIYSNGLVTLNGMDTNDFFEGDLKGLSEPRSGPPLTW